MMENPHDGRIIRVGMQRDLAFLNLSLPFYPLFTQFAQALISYQKKTCLTAPWDQKVYWHYDIVLRYGILRFRELAYLKKIVYLSEIRSTENT